MSDAVTGTQVLEAWADMPREQAEEHEYRRGYRDGWIQAANLLLDLQWCKTLDRTYDVLMRHANGDLWEWAIGCGDWSKEVWAPGGHPRCTYCGRQATVLDHYMPKCLGGTDDESNLVPSCRACNSAKSGMHPNAWIAKVSARSRS